MVFACIIIKIGAIDILWVMAASLFMRRMTLVIMSMGLLMTVESSFTLFAPFSIISMLALLLMMARMTLWLVVIMAVTLRSMALIGLLLMAMTA